MTQTRNPNSVDFSDVSPPVKPGMTLRRKLALLAIPTAIAVISIPVGIAHAQGAAQGRVAPAQTVHMTRTVAVKAVRAVAPNVAAVRGSGSLAYLLISISP